MTDFIYKTYRVEWVVRIGPCDQYGMWMGPADVEEPRPTREAAIELMKTMATYDDHLLRWIPTNTTNGYISANIVYREVLVRTHDGDGSQLSLD